MSSTINSVLGQISEKTEPEKEEVEYIKQKLKEFLAMFKQNLKKKKVGAEPFIGGSFAKNTMIKKDHYDVDIFARFDKKYKDKDISNITKQALAGIKNVQEVHGSRNYFRIRINSSYFEVVPVLKVSNPKDAENITDLSYFHVNYVNKKLKNKKILDEIRIAKVFCHANNVYGAESYISGFSGYGLELLVYHYKTFLNFVKAMVKVNEKDKLIIDIEKHYKNKRDILLDINSAKLASPIILVDPTYRQRNVLAALSEGTFRKFQGVCKEFLRKPSLEAFEPKKINFDEVKAKVKKAGNEFIILKATTDKQEGDIAGSKLVKFFRYLIDEVSKIFDVKDSGFEYTGKKTATYYLAVKRKSQIIKQGPLLKDKENVMKFRKMHTSFFNKSGRIYAKDKIKHDIKDFLNKWEQKNKRQVGEMAVKELRVIG
ncbi:MAG: hypothetical protein WD876_02970 [Candidatus Pacearchaeota archaeon]